MTGRILWLLISVIFWQIAVGDYARYAEFVRQQAKNETFVRLFEKHLQQFKDTSKNLQASATFHCQSLPQPKTKTTSVHRLTPMDVKVIAAMGDSITAGTGIEADTVLGLLKQDRGLSWSIGGDESIDKVQTLANMIKVYDPDVKGYSVGWGPVWYESSSHLNVADPGDKSEAMPGQAVKLVERMKKESNIDFENDWKVITVFVGGNDLCEYCDDKEKYSAENYRANLQEALDYLHAKVPRAFVNLVEILPISIVKELNQNLVCDALHLYLCGCAAYPHSSEAEKEIQAVTKRYREVLKELVESGRYDTKDDFTVVVQPFFSETYPPDTPGSEEPDLSYFAPDCFHLSLKGHRAAADALWNNMIEPVGRKRIKWRPGEQVECPTESHPYFYTYKNSQESLGANAGLHSEHEESDTEAQSGISAIRQRNDAGNQPNSRSGNQSAAIATATVFTVAVVVAVAIFGVRTWRKSRPSGENQMLLSYREI